jgi:ABC-type branched-subunit amino acid transport system ATPase component
VSTPGAALVFDKVSKRFGGVITAAELSMSIDPSACTALVGPNGAGKTTFLNMACGLIRPDAGTISWRDRDITMLRFPDIARQGIGRMFQDLKAFEGLTVEENLICSFESSRFPLPRWRGPNVSDREQVREILERLGLTGVRGRRVSELSYAEQKLVVLGRTVVGNPSFLMLDEPASGLDHTSLQIVLELLEHLRQRGLGILIVEHNLDVVSRMATRVLLLEEGRIAADGPPREVFEMSEFGRVFFSMQDGATG